MVYIGDSSTEWLQFVPQPLLDGKTYPKCHWHPVCSDGSWLGGFAAMVVNGYFPAILIAIPFIMWRKNGFKLYAFSYIFVATTWLFYFIIGWFGMCTPYENGIIATTDPMGCAVPNAYFIAPHSTFFLMLLFGTLNAVEGEKNGELWMMCFIAWFKWLFIPVLYWISGYMNGWQVVENILLCIPPVLVGFIVTLQLFYLGWLPVLPQKRRSVLGFDRDSTNAIVTGMMGIVATATEKATSHTKKTQKKKKTPKETEEGKGKGEEEGDFE